MRFMTLVLAGLLAGLTAGHVNAATPLDRLRDHWQVRRQGALLLDVMFTEYATSGGRWGHTVEDDAALLELRDGGGVAITVFQDRLGRCIVFDLHRSRWARYRGTVTVYDQTCEVPVDAPVRVHARELFR